MGTVVRMTCSKKFAVIKHSPLQVPQHQSLRHLHKVPLTYQLRPAHRTLTSQSVLIRLPVGVSVKQTDRCPMETQTTTSTTVVADTMCSRKSAAVKELQQSLLQVHKMALSWPLRPAHRIRISLSALLKLHAEVSVKQTYRCPMETRTSTSTTVATSFCCFFCALPEAFPSVCV